jgi:hypothetical protein
MLSIKHPYSTEQVVKALMRANPSKKQTERVSIQKWNRYLELIHRAVQKSIIMARKDQIDKDQLPLQWEALNKELGECRVLGDYFNWFHKHFPLVHIIRKGTPGTLTMTELLYDIELSAASQTPADAFETLYSKYADILAQLVDNPNSELVDWVPINQLNLNAYIKSNEHAILGAKRAQHIDTLKRNYIWAKSILLCAEFMDAKGMGSCIPQIAMESDFGRRYYTGLNLQNCPKVVRHAALGRCYQYDLNASVFAWRYNFVKTIDKNIKMPFTLEYIDEKDQRRKQLAHALDLPISFDSKLKIIKELITSIGFGSRPGNTGVAWKDQSGQWQYPAITTLIKSPETRANLLAHPWLAGFIEEQKMISRTIFNAIKELVRDKKFLENERGNLSVNATLAYAYQSEERACIDMLTAQAKEDGVFLLAVHDGFYTSRPVKILPLKELLVEFNPYASISKEEHEAWGFNEGEEEHHERMMQLEKEANQGQIPSEVAANYQRIKYMQQSRDNYHANNEHDNGSKWVESRYNIENDPFYMEE